MHDIDPMRASLQTEMGGFQQESFEYDFEADPETFGVYGETYETGGGDHEIADEILSVSNEEELSRIFGNVIRTAGSALGKAVPPQLSQILSGGLKGIATRVLPTLGGAAGTALGGSMGGSIGGALGGQLAGLFGETGEAGEEREIARKLVDIAGAAARRALQMPPNIDPRAAGKAALTAAIKQVAPGLLGILGQLGIGGAGGDAESPLSQEEEMNLAAELLGVSEDAELDQFLGKVFKSVGKAVGGIVKSPIGKVLGGALKGIAKKALPMVGGALGSFIPIPGVGTAVGTALGTAASNLFEVPLQGETQEEQEFDLARHFVRLAGSAAKVATKIAPGFDPASAAKAALAAAAKRYAPGLLNLLGEVGPTGPARPNGAVGIGARKGMPAAGAAPARPGSSGRWIRRGHRIILLGV
jgi:uncharacterized protein (DUF697 family)